MDIVPIQLSLTEGDLTTLWAPRWREDGDEWEGFLGDADAVHAFPDAAALAAYVRTVHEHDLDDHPAWPLVLQLTVAELVPEEDQCYDLVGVPEIVADEPDTWTVSELAGIVTLARSLADTCGLPEVHDVLNAAEGFALLERGTWAFNGREGGKLWDELADVIASRWDEVLDALDAVVAVPRIDPNALEDARRELAAAGEPGGAPAPGPDVADPDATATDPGTTSAPNATPDPNATPEWPGGPGAAPDLDAEPPGTVARAVPMPPANTPDSAAAVFWESVGIDPILIGLDDDRYFTLRCYLDDKPVFLGRAGRVTALGSAEDLAAHLGSAAADGNDLTAVSTWPRVCELAAAGELEVEVDAQNVYQFDGLSEDLAEGPEAVDPSQLDLGVELLLDVGAWAGDESAEVALRPSQSLGWLTSFVLRPDPSRLAPSPPFDAEAARWTQLVDELHSRFRRP